MTDFSMTITNTFAPNTVIASASMNTNLQTDIRDKFNAAINGSTGHTHDGTTGNGAPTVLQNSAPTVTRQLGFASSFMQFHDGTAARVVVTEVGTQTLTNKTLTAPALSGTVTGTYTLGGTPTISSPSISSPVFSGTATGTYTLGGTPTLSSPVISGTATGTYTLGGTPTLSGPIISSPKVTTSSLNDIGDQSTTAAFDWSLANHHRVRFTGNAAVTFSNAANRQKITIEFAQDTTGSRVPTWPTNVRWLNGSGATDSTTDKPTLTTTASKVDILSFTYNSTLGLYYGSVVGFKGAIT